MPIFATILEQNSETATLEVNGRVITARFTWEDVSPVDTCREWAVALDGPECREVFDTDEAPADATPHPGWDGCASAAALLTPAECFAVESALAENNLR